MADLTLVIFDCDGTLIDSEIIAAQVNAEMFKEAGYEIEAAEIAARFAGLNLPRIVEAVSAESGIIFPPGFIERTRAETDRRLAEEVEDLAGAHEVLDRIALPRCICSNSSLHRLQASLEHVGLWERFEPHVYSAVEVGTKRGKPAPDVFHFACNEFGVTPAEAVVLEDSVHGVAAAAAAGCRVVGFTGASHSFPGHAEALSEAGAETVISRLLDFPQVIDAFAAWERL